MINGLNNDNNDLLDPLIDGQKENLLGEGVDVDCEGNDQDYKHKDQETEDRYAGHGNVLG